MIQHNGMRPQDIGVLLKIVSLENQHWFNKDLADGLHLSNAEVSYSLQRSAIAGLIDKSKRRVMRQTLLEFIQYGLPYVFPAIKGTISRGVLTAYSTSLLHPYFMQHNEHLVWEHPKGNSRGTAISPLYPGAVEAALKDSRMYDLLALIDVMRLGKVREKTIALKLLKEKMKL